MSTDDRVTNAKTRTAANEGGLILAPNIDDGDGFYDELLQAHDGLDEAASHALNARLILVLCNHIGDRQVLRAALSAACSSVAEDRE